MVADTSDLGESEPVSDAFATPRLAPLVARRWLAAGDAPGHRRVTGSLLFADISGYTRVSERLARRGRVGSEEATALVDRVLRALIEAIGSRGGDILDFAGDALVALFPAADSAAEGTSAVAASSAAVAIREWFDDHGTQTTSVGRVQLQASVSVASGPVDLFLSGPDDELALFVAGPTATRLVLLERAAVAGEIRICPATAAALAGRRGILTREAHHVLSRGFQPDSGERMLWGAEVADDLRLVPRALRTWVGTGNLDLDSDHRLATIAFIVVGGLDDRIMTDPPAVAADLDAILQVVSEAAARHRVSILDTDVTADGVALFLAAGAPLATGTDEERMLRTLRAVMTSSIAARLQVRAGTHRGPVFAGVVGTAYRATYSAMGDTTNLAARLAYRAAPGELLATPEVLSRSAAEFEADAAIPFRPKGKAATVTPYRVGRETGRHERAPESLPVVGRDRELATLRQHLDAALAGRGSVVSLVGEPGVGKSRLAAEVLGDERIGARFVVRFGVGDEATPYAGLRRSLRALAGLGDHPASPEPTGRPEGDDPEHEAHPSGGLEGSSAEGKAFGAWVESLRPGLQDWWSLIGIPFGVDLPAAPGAVKLAPRFRRQRMHALVTDLLAATLGPGSVLLLEDLHWSDEASLALLDDLASGAADRGWLVLALTRSSEFLVDPDNHTPVELTGIPPEAVTELALAATATTPLSDAELRSIVERGAGNPLYVRELAVATVERGLGSADELPDGLEQLLAARIDRLAPSDRALLRRAAVLGRTVDLGVLGEVLSDQPDATDLARWSRLEEFVEWAGEGQLRYRHDVYAEAAYAGLPERVARELHARAAQALRRRAGDDLDPIAAVLAAHYQRAGDVLSAYAFGRRGGDVARAQAANVDAAALYRRALAAGAAAGVPPGELAVVAEALGDVAELAGRYDEALAGYAAARRLYAPSSGQEDAATMAMARARVARLTGIVCERQGRYREALGWYTRANGLLGEDAQAGAVRTRLLLDRAGVRQRQGRPADTVRLALSAAEQAGELGERDQEAHAYYLLHAAYGDLGDPEALRYRDLALPIYEELGDLTGQGNVLNNLGVDAYYEGRWTDALEFYRRSSEARRRLGDVTNETTEINNEAEILSDQGHLAQARSLFTTVLRRWKSAGYGIGVALVTGNLGRLCGREGRTDEGLALLDEATALFEQLGSTAFVQEMRARSVECLVLAGRIEDAQDLAGQLLASDRREAAAADPEIAHLVPLLERSLGWCALLRGDPDAARTRFDASLASARRAEAAYDTALTLRAMARVVDPDEQRVCRAEADEIFAGLGVLAVTEPLTS